MLKDNTTDSMIIHREDTSDKRVQMKGNSGVSLKMNGEKC